MLFVIVTASEDQTSVVGLVGDQNRRTVPRVRVRRIRLSIHSNVVPGDDSGVGVRSGINEVVLCSAHVSTESLPSRFGELTKLDVSSRVADNVAYLPPLPTVMEPSGGALNAKTLATR